MENISTSSTKVRPYTLILFMFMVELTIRTKTFFFLVFHEYFDKKEARKLDTYSWYGIAASVQAVADSGLDAEGIDKNEIGVIWGSGIGGLDTFQNETFAFAKG